MERSGFIEFIHKALSWHVPRFVKSKECRAIIMLWGPHTACTNLKLQKHVSFFFSSPLCQSLPVLIIDFGDDNEDKKTNLYWFVSILHYIMLPINYYLVNTHDDWYGLKLNKIDRIDTFHSFDHLTIHICHLCV